MIFRVLLFIVIATVSFSQHVRKGSLSTLLDSRKSRIPEATHPVHYDSSCIFTISAWNNFGFVRAFFESASSSNPNIKCRVWVVADKPSPVPALISEMQSKLNFQIVTVHDLQKISPFDISELAFKFDLVEFATTIKPLAFLFLMRKMDIKHALYFDNDCWITDSLDDLLYQLQTRLVVATPHISTPIPLDGETQTDLQILKAGVLNFGFIAFSTSQRSIDFLWWWYERLRYYGYVDLKRGMHFDQNWGHFIMAFFDHNEYYVIRDHRYNVAYWNLHYTGERLHLLNGIPYLGHEKVVFMHMSGVSSFESYDSEHISRHQSRYSLSHFPAMRNVLTKFTSHVMSFNVSLYRPIPYGYNYFTNGDEIPPILRQLYKELSDAVLVLSPYDLATKSEAKLWFQSHVFNPFEKLVDYMLNGPYNYIIDMPGSHYFSEMEHVVYRSRPDVQQVYPDIFGVHYWPFKEWFRNNAKTYNIKGRILEEWTKRVEEVSTFRRDHAATMSSRAFGVSVIGWPNGIFGVGISSALIYDSLAVTDVPVDVVYLYGADGHKHIAGRVPPSALTRQSLKPINIVVANADNTPLVQELYPQQVWREHYNVGVWAWELELFPDMWMAHLAVFDEIWVPSVFIKKAIESSPRYGEYKTPLVVMPFGYQFPQPDLTEPINSTGRTDMILNGQHAIKSSSFLFLSVFDYQSVFDRKNPLAVVRAFKEAFPVELNLDVLLVIKSSSSSPKYRNSRVALVRAIGGDSRIVLVEGALSDEEMKKLHNRCNCFASLHRSEGYGLNILQAMASRKPTIATDYSGNKDFFDASPLIRTAHFPISYTLVPLTSEYDPYNPYTSMVSSAVWAEPNHDEAVKAMVAASKGVSVSALDKARLALMESFGHIEVGKKMAAHLNKVMVRKRGPGAANLLAKQAAMNMRYNRARKRGSGDRVNFHPVRSSANVL